MIIDCTSYIVFRFLYYACLTSCKTIQSSSAKKLAKWTFLTARQKKGPIPANMTHQELWAMMDNRINAVGPRSQYLVAENDHIVWDKCGPWDTSQRTDKGLVIVQHQRSR